MPVDGMPPRLVRARGDSLPATCRVASRRRPGLPQYGMRRRRSSSASTYAWPLAVLLIVLLVQWWEWQRGSTQAPDDVRPPEPAAAPSSPEPLEPEGNWLQGRVRHVFDGDTVELVTSQGTWRVRLKGID